jgi:hypothetical protein
MQSTYTNTNTKYNCEKGQTRNKLLAQWVHKMYVIRGRHTATRTFSSSNSMSCWSSVAEFSAWSICRGAAICTRCVKYNTNTNTNTKYTCDTGEQPKPRHANHKRPPQHGQSVELAHVGTRLHEVRLKQRLDEQRVLLRVRVGALGAAAERRNVFLVLCVTRHRKHASGARAAGSSARANSPSSFASTVRTRLARASNLEMHPFRYRNSFTWCAPPLARVCMTA